MSLGLRLDAKTESLIGRLAKKRRQSKSQVVRDAIGLLANQNGKETRQRPYERMAHLIGCIDSGGARLSQNTGARFAKLLREQTRARRSR
jgi:Arc/MetJ-type ribon-helix-helix transcriptional regulator